MLTSPAENHPLLRALGDNNAEVERRGADFLIMGRDGLTACQRKAVPDLVASLSDDRLWTELRQMAEASDLAHAFLIVEGHWNQGWETRAQLDGILMSLQIEHGLCVMWTQSVAETAETLRRMEAWLMKGSHGSLMNRRAGPRRDADGTLARLHIWQTFPRIKYGRAVMLDTHFDHKLPLEWTCDWDAEVIPGFGKVIKTGLKEALNGTQ